MPMIVIANVMNGAQGEPLRARLNGKTAYDLKVAICPIGGSCDVVVSTTCPISTNELRGIVLNTLAEELMDALSEAAT